jgi:hypothetical protein
LAIVNLRHMLHFQIMIAGTECVHLFALAILGAAGNFPRQRVGNAAVFLDPLQVVLCSVAVRLRLFRSAQEHGGHFPVI